MHFYKQRDIDSAPLAGKIVAIIGYGNQGKPQALNLRDSGISVVVGFRDSSLKKADALAEGFPVMSISQATQAADVVMMLLPDEAIGPVYAEQVAPFLKPNTYLGFCHGMAIFAQMITPLPLVNVFLLAPKSQGTGVRNQYLAKKGVPGLVAVHQDPSGDTLKVALAYGNAIGCGMAGILPTTFAEETISNHFSEQAVLCGGLTQLIKTAFEVQVEAGISPEVAYFGALHEVSLLADLIKAHGISGMRDKISPTALYGDVTRGPRVIDAHVKESMRQMLQEVSTDSFSKEFLAEVAQGYPVTQQGTRQDDHHLVDETFRALKNAQII